MFRHSIPALAVLFLFGIVLSAAEYKGTIEKIDGKKGTMSVKVGDKVQNFEITYMAKIYDTTGKESTGKKRLAILKPSDDIVITTEVKKIGDADKEVITKVELKKK